MSRSHLRRLVGTAILIALAANGCESPPTTPEAVAFERAPGTDLDVLAPGLEQTLLTPKVVLGPTEPPPGSGPLLSTTEDGPAEIFNEKTVVGFLWDEAYAEGSHYYTGSVGRVATTLHVSLDNMHVTSVPAERQRNDWLSLSVRKYVWAYARAKIDRTCGLRLNGNSRHSAFWSFFQISSTTNYGEVIRSSNADPASQNPCGVSISNQDPTGTYNPEQGFTCTYLITYDMDTLEIISAELLSCQTSGILI